MPKSDKLKILITGASGFLGKILVHELTSSSHIVSTLSRSKYADYQLDISQNIDIDFPYFDIVVHAAGKAHTVPKKKEEKQAFFNINTNGTKNVLEALHKEPPKCFVFISTVAVYGVDSGEEISEEFPIKGETPYAKSKIKAEELVLDWGKRINVNVMILRLPLISGENPPGNLKSMAESIRSGYYFRVGKGQNRKSMVSAKDLGKLIPVLLNRNGIYNLTDNCDPSLAQIDGHIAAQYSKQIKVISPKIAYLLAKVGNVIPSFPLNTRRLDKLNSTLTFSDQKARNELAWKGSNALNDLKFSQ